MSVASQVNAATGRPRARDVGIRIGPLATGPHNAITDVAGVRVGHVTLNSGDGPWQIGYGPVRTGVTAIVPATTRSSSATAPAVSPFACESCASW